MLTPLLHSTPRRRLRWPRPIRRWWAGLSRDERQGVVITAVTVVLFVFARLAWLALEHTV
jgi:hypothetical protein